MTGLGRPRGDIGPGLAAQIADATSVAPQSEERRTAVAALFTQLMPIVVLQGEQAAWKFGHGRLAEDAGAAAVAAVWESLLITSEPLRNPGGWIRAAAHGAALRIVEADMPSGARSAERRMRRAQPVLERLVDSRGGSLPTVSELQAAWAAESVRRRGAQGSKKDGPLVYEDARALIDRYRWQTAA